MSTPFEKERTLQRQIGTEVESALPGVEVLAVELSSPTRFTVFIDHPEGVDHALCGRVTDVLRPYLREYGVEVSSPGFQRPLRKPEHFRAVVGHEVAVRAQGSKRLRGEVVGAGERAVTIQAPGGEIEIPYDQIVRGNLIETAVR
ncbi:MAG: ribosome maturation factor RimP [Actinomycetota bacterium]|nr:ribosome maturation factor RimP [Actinomycetota bacterium]